MADRPTLSALGEQIAAIAERDNQIRRLQQFIAVCCSRVGGSIVVTPADTDRLAELETRVHFQEDAAGGTMRAWLSSSPRTRGRA